MSSYIGSRRFAVESRNEAGAFPKLYRAPVRKLLGVLECRFIAGGFKIRTASIMTVRPHGVDAKPAHERAPCAAARPIKILRLSRFGPQVAAWAVRV